MTRLFNWRGRRFEPGDLFDTAGMSVGQVASLRRLTGLEPVRKKKSKKKKGPDVIVGLIEGEKDE